MMTSHVSAQNLGILLAALKFILFVFFKSFLLVGAESNIDDGTVCKTFCLLSHVRNLVVLIL